MNALELKEAIREKVQQAAKNNIFGKTLDLLAVKVGRDNESPFITNATFSITMPNGVYFQVRKSVTRNDVTRIIIRVGHNEVFNAEAVTDKNDPFVIGPCIKERIVRMESKHQDLVYISTYTPGEWEQWLDLGAIEGALRDAERRREAEDTLRKQQEEQKALEKEKTRPLTREEIALAERFGIYITQSAAYVQSAQ